MSGRAFAGTNRREIFSQLYEKNVAWYIYLDKRKKAFSLKTSTRKKKKEFFFMIDKKLL